MNNKLNHCYNNKEHYSGISKLESSIEEIRECHIFHSLPYDPSKNEEPKTQSDFSFSFMLDPHKTPHSLPIPFPSIDTNINITHKNNNSKLGISNKENLYKLNVDSLLEANLPCVYQDAWIPSEPTRNILTTASERASAFGSSQKSKLLTMPVFSPKDEMFDSIGQWNMQMVDELSIINVTQDECGLLELINGEQYRSAANLTGRLLTVYGQGVGKLDMPIKHCVHYIQLWFTRLILLVKLQEFKIADAEAVVWWDCDSRDIYYQFHPELYSRLSRCIIPFQMRLLLANLPSYCGRHKESLNRLFSVLATVKKVLRVLVMGRIENGNQDDLTIGNHNNSMELWKARANRVLVSVINTALEMEDFCLVIDVMNNLINSQNDIAIKKILYSTLGRIYLQYGDIKGAENSFIKAQASCQNVSIQSNNNQDFQDLVDWGLLAVAQNDFQEAYKHFEKASFVDPSNIMVMNNCAVCLMYLGHQKEAIRLLAGTVNNNPFKALQEKIILNLSVLYQMDNSYNEKMHELLELTRKCKGDLIMLPCLRLLW